jgi:hypothetical protein
MDYRQTPCADTDFAGYSDKTAYAPVTGEYKIPWPPKSTLHRHPSNWMFWVVLAIAAMWAVCGIVGLVVVVRWLF